MDAARERACMMSMKLSPVPAAEAAREAARSDADTQLMLRFQEGEETCFELLVHRHSRPLLHFLTRMVASPQVSEELVQESFLRIYQARQRYRPEARFSTWLYRIATRVALNHLRKCRKDRFAISLNAGEDGEPVWEPADQAPGTEEDLLRRERAQRVRRAIGALPERQRAAVLMHKYQGLDYRAIGEALGLSQAATKSLLFRAYETLREELRDLLEGGQA